LLIPTLAGHHRPRVIGVSRGYAAQHTARLQPRI
jgi:hypothetical protein